MVLVGGTVVTAEASFRADVAVEGEQIAAVGSRPADERRRGRRRVRRAADAGLHRRAHAPRHALRRHRHLRRLGHRDGGRRRRRDDDAGRLLPAGHRRHAWREAVETWQGKADGKARIDYGLHVAITNLTEAVKAEIPVAARARRVDDQDLHGLQGHAALHRRRGPLRGDADRARGRRAGAACTPRTATSSPSSRPQALARGDTDPHWHALTRPDAGRGRGDRPRDPPGRDRRHAAATSSTSPAPTRWRRSRRARARGSTVYAETCPQYLVLRVRRPRAPELRGRQVRLLAAAARRRPTASALWRGAAGRRPADLRLGPLLVQLRTARRSSAATTSRRSRTACPDSRSAPAVLWTEGVRGGHISEQLFVAVLSTNQARSPRHAPGARARSRRAPTPTSSSGIPT